MVSGMENELLKVRGLSTTPPVSSLPIHDGQGWRTISADPPWPFADLGSRATPDYPYMTEEQILELPVARIAAISSHLYLWVPDTHLELGLRVVRAWGFTFKHQIVWAKTSDVTGNLQIGMGHYFRKAHEVCLFATAGKTPVLRRDCPSVFFASRRKHSQKPDEFFGIVESMSPEPRLELFGREPRPGWTVWGNEADGNGRVWSPAQVVHSVQEPERPCPGRNGVLGCCAEHEFCCYCQSNTLSPPCIVAEENE
jgi:N6-adenosine-specific RNA methylase IME4